MTFAHAAPVLATAFMASLVEAVEAMTIVLAVATIRGWRPAVLGALSGFAILAATVIALGPLLKLVPMHLLQLVIGLLLLLFGGSWLRKAVKRSAGVMAMKDEERAFAEETAELRSWTPVRHGRLDWLAGLTSFKAVLLEGIEVVFIVIALSAGHTSLIPASAGAVAALLLVISVGLIVHRPLTRVPENTLKFAVGVILTAFGIFWSAEGLGYVWPGGAMAIGVLAALVLLAAQTAVHVMRRLARNGSPHRSSY